MQTFFIHHFFTEISRFSKEMLVESFLEKYKIVVVEKIEFQYVDVIFDKIR